jgi:alkylation response protein AidB-like acyl-CoA dehydrogenase
MPLTHPEELLTLKEATARFAAEHLAPHAQEWDRAEGYPDSLIPLLGEQGYLGILLPEELGGAGGNYQAFAVILEELARHDGGVALSVEAHNGLCCQHISIAGNDAQKKKFLPPLARGEYLGAWCLTEPGSGTDAAAMKTRARKEGGEWIIDGSKQFITNGDRAGVYVVTAVTDPGKGKDGISAFAVERGAPGLSTGKREEKLGMRSSDTVPVMFEAVRVPEENLLGEVDRGFEDVKVVLERGRVMISAISIGLARGALEESLKYSAQREAFGKPIGDYQAIQAKIADMATQIEAGRLLLANTAGLLDEGQRVPYEGAITKLFTSELATRVCLEAIQVHGGYGYLRDYNVERYLRDAKLCEIGEGTSEILRVLIAKQAAKNFFVRQGA